MDLRTTSLDIKHDFINFYYRAPNKINADLGFQHFKILRFTNKIEFLFSLVFNMLIIYCTFQCQLTPSEVNSTQILLIFESMQHFKNDQEQEKLF